MTTLPPTQPPFHRLLLSLAVAAAAAPAGAQTTTTEATGPDAVIVTGTRTRDRTVLTATSPIDVLHADDLRRAAGPEGSLAAALQVLLPSFNFPRQSNSGAADHVRAAQLRGMSPDQVLVLVNGKRRHTSAVVNLESKTGKGTNPVDFSALPLGAIKRVEVLRDGAGAQYGSDAVAGVINVILDDAAQGGEAVATGGAYRTRFAPTGQRLTDGQATELQLEHGWRLAEGFLRAGVELGHRNGTNRAGLDGLPFFEAHTEANLATQGRRNYVAGDPETDKKALWLNGALALDGGHQAYAFGTWSRRDSVGAAYFRYPDSEANPGRRYPQGYRPETIGRSDDLSLVAGVRGPLVGWELDTSLAYGRNDFRFGVRRSLNASLGDASPTRFDLGRHAFSQLGANLDLSRPLAIGLARPATLAVGADLRREAFRSQAGDEASWIAGPLQAPPGAQAGPGLAPADEADRSRRVAGVYADLSADLGERWFAQAATRYDHYSDAGGAGTGKLSARWQPAPQWALRGALSSSFRAPSLAQSAFSYSVANYGDGGVLSQVRTLPVDSEAARALGARPLKPERSRQVGLGLTAQPLRGMSVTLDVYRIDVKDRITLSERFSSPALSALLPGVEGVNFFTNAVDTRTRGADLVAQWQGKAAQGDLQLSAAASASHTRIRRTEPLPAALAGLGVSGLPVGLEEANTLTTAAPRQRQVFSAQWTGAAWGGLLRATRHGKTTRVFDFGDGFTPTQTYGATWQLDAELEWRPTRQWALAVGGLNITNRYPDRSSDDIAYFGNLPYDVLSPIGFNGAYWYARARYSF
ncbi:TonB-dependent receptor plug domain-containing protein [Aquincola tertiaricarbonis]|uniref:TonB-dependent receptor plug domain-containing protein n=1 Tax=Aquincola tertiaricarbonis TaxID=391953 RepID=UPI0006149B46|nr:TonB-dependent receptor [Aquincola tertiaricarbonis]